jgi:hypothetical protein
VRADQVSAWPLAAGAQQPEKLPTIGFVGSDSPGPYADRLRAFAQFSSSSGKAALNRCCAYRLKLSLTLPRPQTLLPGSRCIIDWLSAFLSEDIGSLLKRDEEVCQRQLVNEVLGPLVTEFARNLGREATTPI